MVDCEIHDLANSEKEFKYSVGYCFENTIHGYMIAGHSCTNKPIYFFCNKTEFLQKHKNACPKCGQPVLRWDDMCFYWDENSETPASYFFSTINLIRIKADHSKVSIGILVSHYSLWGERTSFSISSYYDRYTINIKTGYTYEFNRQSLNRNNTFSNSKKLVNISYYGTICGQSSGIALPFDALKHISIVISKNMNMVHGENMPSFESYGIELSFNNLIYFVRNPYINPVLYNEIINKSRRTLHGSLRLKEVLVKNICREPLQKMLSQSKIPDVKSLRKIVFTDTRGFPLLASISRSFRNVDMIRSLYTAYIDCREDEFDVYIDFSAKVFRTMIKHKNEKLIALKLLSFKKQDKNNNAYRTLLDIIRCYAKLKDCDFDFTKSYSIDELHLYLADLVFIQENQNRTIEYTHNELYLEACDDKFSISLAKDTHELKNTGSEMEICVGSYADDVVNKKSTILILRRIEDFAAVGCIELRKGTVKQVKGPHNQLLQDQEMEFIENWIQEQGLTVGTNDLR